MVDGLKLGYYDWIGGFTGADDDPFANGDGDRLCHYLEYLLGGNPKLDDADQLVDYAIREIDGTNYLSALYARNPQALDNTHAECAGDGTPLFQTTNAQRVLERDVAPTTDATHRFLRLKAGW